VADEEPAGIVTEVVAVPPEVAAKTVVPVELEDRPTAVGAVVVVGLPEAPCSWTVTGPVVAAAEADPEVGAEVIASLLAAATVTAVLAALVAVQVLKTVTTR